MQEEKEYKGIIRIPTEQYAYIEIHAGGSVEEILELNTRVTKLYKGGEGLTEKEFDNFLDTYLSTDTGDVNVYEKMNREQSDRIQMLKRSFKRIAYKQDKNNKQ